MFSISEVLKLIVIYVKSHIYHLFIVSFIFFSLYISMSSLKKIFESPTLASSKNFFWITFLLYIELFLKMWSWKKPLVGLPNLMIGFEQNLVDITNNKLLINKRNALFLISRSLIITIPTKKKR